MRVVASGEKALLSGKLAMFKVAVLLEHVQTSMSHAFTMALQCTARIRNPRQSQSRQHITMERKEGETRLTRRTAEPSRCR